MTSFLSAVPHALTNGDAWRGRIAYVFLAAIVLLMHLPGLFSLPPLDRDESRYAQATVQMLETGDFIDIRYQDGPRYKKPVGIHWLQAVSVQLFSNVERREIWAFRLPSLLGVILACLFTYWGMSRMFTRQIGFTAALLTSSTIVVAGEATIAKTDGVLFACLTASQLALALMYVGNRFDNRLSLNMRDLDWLWRLSPLALLFWVALAFGTLIKGPVAPVITTLTCATLIVVDRRFGWMKALAPLPGIALYLAIVMPWVIAIWTQTDGRFFTEAFLVDVGPKMVSHQETHGGPIGYYTLLSPILLWPTSLFVLPALMNAWSVRLTPAIKFCLVWAIVTWIFFEVNPTKLPHYVLPTFPAIAALCAVYIFRQKSLVRSAISRTQDMVHLISAIFWLVISVAIAAIVSLLPILFTADTPREVLYGTVAIAGLSIIVYLMQIRAQRQLAAYATILLAVVSFYVILETMLPSLKQLDTSRRLVAAIEQHTGGTKAPVISVGYNEPSYVFLTATDTQLVDAGTAARLLGETPGAVATIEGRQKDKFIAAAEADSLILNQLDTVTGYNYSNGDRVTVTLYTAKPAAAGLDPDTAPDTETETETGAESSSQPADTPY